MPPVSLDDVKITSNGNTVTIGDSVKIVVSGTGQSPTKVKISRSPTPTNTTQDSKTLALSEQKERSKSPVPKRTEGMIIVGPRSYAHKCCDDVNKAYTPNNPIYSD